MQGARALQLDKKQPRTMTSTIGKESGMDYIPLAMIREGLEDIPQFAVPPPLTVRWYRRGDEETWLRIQMAADKYSTFHPRKFEEEFGRDEQLLKQRQCYLCDGEGNEIGTTTAWFNDHYHGQRFGRVHWAAIVPEMQGKGLAKPMMTIICNRLRSLGHERAYLTTQTVSFRAINLYLKFAFVPEIRGERDVHGWLSLRERIRPEYWARAVSAVPELA